VSFTPATEPLHRKYIMMSSFGRIRPGLDRQQSGHGIVQPNQVTEAGFAGWIPFAIMVIGIVAVAALRLAYMDDLLLAMDNDSAMRLVQVRDLLAGQGWFDLTQHRLGDVLPVEMHWSRMIDGPMIAFILFFDLFTDRPTAESAFLIVWPSLWLATTFWTTVKISSHFGGAFASTAALFPCLMILLTAAWFYPGNIDHHNVQLSLLMLSIWGLIGRHRGIGRSALTGLAVASSLVIGAELLPLMATFCLGVAGIWAVRGRAEQGATIAFGLCLAGGMLAFFLLTAPASAYDGGFCDAVSIDLLLPVAASGLLLAAGAVLYSGRSRRVRIAALLVFGIVVLVATKVYLPSCLSNPLTRLDPFLVRYWLNYVAEAQGMASVVAGPQQVFYSAAYFLGAGGLVITMSYAIARRHQAELWILGLLICVGLGVAVYQVRYLPIVLVLSIPAWASLAASLRNRATKSGSVVSGLASAAVLVLSAPQAWAVIAVALEMSQGTEGAKLVEKSKLTTLGWNIGCFQRDAFSEIERLPPGRVSATSNLGSQILLQSRHSVLSAPYHRNEAGMRAQLGIALAADASDAAARLRAHDIDYLIICSDDPETSSHSLEPGSGQPLFLQLIAGVASLPGYPLRMKMDDIYVYGRSSD